MTLESRRAPQNPCPPANGTSVTAVIKFLVKIVLMAVVFYFVAKYVPGIDVDENPNAVLGLSITFVWLALLFAIVNAILGPVIKLLSLPFVILTLGLFYLVINAALLGLTALLSSKLDIDGFGAAILGGLILAVASWVCDLLLRRD
jgi:putative membrane protein